MQTNHIVALCLWLAGIAIGVYINIKARSHFYRPNWRFEACLLLMTLLTISGWEIMFYGFDGVLAKVLKFLHSVGMSFPLG